MQSFHGTLKRLEMHQPHSRRTLKSVIALAAHAQLHKKANIFLVRLSTRLDSHALYFAVPCNVVLNIIYSL